MDRPFPLVDVLATILILAVLVVVSMSFSLSSLVDLCSLSTPVLLAVIDETNGTCLLSECCRLLMRSRKETFGLIDELAIGPGIEVGIKPAIRLVVVFVVAFRELNIAFDETESLIVVTAGCVD